MKDCKDKERLIDFLEGTMSPEELTLFKKHLEECDLCRNESIELKKLYDLIDKDEVLLPEREFFEQLKENIRKKEIPLRKSIWKTFGILAPAFGLIIFLILSNIKREEFVEVSIPTALLLQDENFNNLLLDRILNDELMDQFRIIEEYIQADAEQALMEMTLDERDEFINLIMSKYKDMYLHLNQNLLQEVI